MKTDNKDLLRKSDAGVTLVELLAAMVILAFGAVAALSFLVETHKSNTFARAKTMAINAAEEQLERVFEADPAEVTGFDDDVFFVGDLVGDGPGGEPGLITVSEFPGGDPHLVTVTVTWQGSGTLSGGTFSISAIRSTITRT